MTIASFARWFGSHEDPTFTRLIASRDARTLVAATVHGGIWVFDLDKRAQEATNASNANDTEGDKDVSGDSGKRDGGGERLKIVPKLKLLGHRSQVEVLELCRLESEVVDEDDGGPENSILSVSEDGEVALWDRADGRCHLSRAHCFPGRPTTAQLTPSGKRILIGGQSNEIVVLDTATLQTVRLLNIYEDWISAFCVLPTELAQNALVVTATFSNQIRLSLFNETTNDFTSDLVDPHQLEFPGWTQAHMIRRSNIDERILLVLSKKACSIFFLESNRTIVFLCNIPVPEGRSWAGVRHLDHGLVLLWTYNGTAQIYSFGSRSRSVYPASKSDTGLRIARVASAPDEKDYHSRHVVANLLLSEQDVLPAYPETNDDDDTVAYCYGPARSGETERWTLLCFKSVPAKPMEIYTFIVETSASSGDKVVLEEPRRIDCEFRYKFSDILAPRNSAAGVVTAACLLRHEKVALGYEDGTVRIVPLTAMIYRTGPSFEASDDPHVPAWERREAAPHRKRATALFEYPGSNGAEDLLLAGFSDGHVVVLNLTTLDAVHEFQGHVEAVVSFFRPPRQVLPRYSQLLCSVAADNSIVLMDLEEASVLLTFSGHEAPISLIAFRTEDAYMCVKTTDGLLHVWSLKSGHLDRMESDEWADDILATCDQRSRVVTEPVAGNLDSGLDSTVIAIPVHAKRPGEGISMLLISTNIKKLCQDAHRGKRTFAIRGNGGTEEVVSLTAARPSSISKDRPGGTPRGLAPPRTPPPLASSSRTSLQVPDMNESPSRPSFGRATPSDMGDGDGDVPDDAFVHATLSASMSWGMAPNMDRIYRDKLELTSPSDNLTLALRGSGGFWSCFSPESPRGKAEWCMSHYLTANRILNALVLSRSLLSLEIHREQRGGEGFEEEIATIITHYGVLLPELVGPKFRLASLAFLVRFWQDPLPEIQQAARSIFRATVSKWNPKVRQLAIQYWFAKLAGRDPQSSSDSARAAIILAVLGSGDSSAMDSKICADVAAALISMAGEGKIGFRVAALELLGRGFTTWEPHISATSLIRYLEQLAGFLPTATAISPTPGPVGVASPISSPGAGQQQPPSVQQMARQAILSIATSSTAVFVQTLVLDLTHAKTAEERKGCLRLISVFIHKKPSVLYPHLLRVVEGVTKCLEPTNPQLRETLLQFVTAALHDLVKTYPSIGFHGSTQRLVCGDFDGPCIVFDLKTGQRFQILEGHGFPVTAVAFSPSGKIAASYSSEEGSILIYYLTSSFFGLLSGSTNSGGAPIKPSKFLAVHQPGEQLRGDAWQYVRLEFTSERSIKLSNKGGSQELPF